jgi:hypothetical protein
VPDVISWKLLTAAPSPLGNGASAALACVVSLFAQQAVCRQAPPARLPDALRPPAGVVLKEKLSAKGVQIYQCQGTDWKALGPQAQLFDAKGHQVASHYAGPTWKSADGSSVIGEVTAHVDAPDPSAIAWLLLSAKATSGSGVFSHVQSIQRLQTVGGKAPTDACDVANANKVARVPYQATYYFYVPKPAHR